MFEWKPKGLLRVSLLLMLGGAVPLTAARAEEAPKFYEDVLPIFQANCVKCHREGEGAPMALDSYEAVRPWVKSIRKAVAEESMPPWLASRDFGHFSNEMGLTHDQIVTITKWAQGGAPAGDKSKAPAPVEFPKGWQLGQPDEILTMTHPYTLAGEGPDEYKYFTIPTDFKEDKWVTSFEVKPGNLAVVHHVIVYVEPPGSSPRLDEGGKVKTNSYVPESPEKAAEAVQKAEAVQAKMEANSRKPMPAAMDKFMLGGMAPGMPPWKSEHGEARLIKAGSRIVFQMHYHRNGKDEVDQTSIGLKYASAPATQQRVTLGIFNMAFAVPPGANEYRVDSWYTFNEDVHLYSFMPHMHLRGKSFDYIAEYPDGRKEVLLSVPKYNFAWQYSYELAEPVAIPKGVTIHCIATFDNSDKNPANPDPTRVVRFGEPTEDEMMIGWVDLMRDSEAKGASSLNGAKTAAAQEVK